MILYRLAVAFAQSDVARCEVENEDVIGAASTDDAPTTSEWSTILLHTKLRVVLEGWRYVLLFFVLQVLKLKRLPFVEIDNNVFQGMKALNELWVTSCGLVAPPPLNHIRNTIRYLSIGQNNIQCIPNGYFEGCTELKIIAASYNIMTSVPNVDAVADTITYIFMNYNKIISMESLNDTYFPRLCALHLGHNYISAISGSFLKNMPSLYMLILNNNHLLQIPDLRVMLHNRFKQPLSVQFESNQWNCGANLLWIWDGVDHKDNFSFDINNITLLLLDVFRMRCHSPNHTRGLSFWDISKYNIHMLNWHWNHD